MKSHDNKIALLSLSFLIAVCAVLTECGGGGGDDGDPTTSSTTYNLAIERNGNDIGTISSTPGGIDCGTDCSADIIANTVTTLTASPDAASVFRLGIADGTTVTLADGTTVTLETGANISGSRPPPLDVATVYNDFSTLSTNGWPPTFVSMNNGYAINETRISGILDDGTPISQNTRCTSIDNNNDPCGDVKIVPSPPISWLVGSGLLAMAIGRAARRRKAD